MCGICGIYTFNGVSIDPNRVLSMRDAMLARGPDSGGLSCGPNYVLGHRRLAIIDLSPAGDQPMKSQDGSIEIVFNGEIYNFLELQRQLENCGRRFVSYSDTEVLIQAYQEWGLKGLLGRIRGMFAFSLVDRRIGEIHLARDPLGKKPLFFHKNANELLFASTAGALIKGMESAPSVNIEALDDLFFNLCIPGYHSIFSEVEKVTPGHAITIDRDGRRSDFTYWHPDFFHPQPGFDYETWLEKVEAALKGAIKRRLIADVPLGILLSGGVDSSLITALASGLVSDVPTFSVATQDPALDESKYARAVAERYGTKHTELPVTGEVRKDLARLVAGMGEPFSDASAANLYSIAHTAHNAVTVILTGDGGDEIFGGYTNFWAYYYADQMQRFLPEVIRPLAANFANVLRQGPKYIRRTGTVLRFATLPIEKSFASFPWIEAATRLQLFTPEANQVIAHRVPWSHYQTLLEAQEGSSGALLLDRAMQVHMQTILPDDYLAKVDYATMATSVEARSPFLDLDVVELAMQIPAKMRLSKGTPKAILRDLGYRYLPRQVIDRRKQGFVTPIGRWLLNEWSDLVNELILGPQVERRGWFNRCALEQIIAEQKAGKNRTYLLWSLLILELWMRVHVEQSISPESTL